MKDPYVYEGTNVLKNKLNIKDNAKLDEAENSLSGLAMINLRNSDFSIKKLRDVFEIHRQLFGYVYDWAGKPRTIDIYKSEQILGGSSIDYVFASYIDQTIDELEEEYKKVKWNKLSSKELIEKISYFVSEFWHIHPFREGNTRTASMMLYLMLKQFGLHVDTTFLSKHNKYFRNALVLSCLYSNSKPEYFVGIVTDSSTIKNFETSKYETIDGQEVAKYSYTHHTIKKLETIKKPSDWRK